MRLLWHEITKFHPGLSHIFHASFITPKQKFWCSEVMKMMMIMIRIMVIMTIMIMIMVLQGAG